MAERGRRGVGVQRLNINDKVSHDLQNAKDLESTGLDQGCFFYS